MAGRITLAEFLQLPAGERRDGFEGLSVADQLAFIEAADPVTLILGGYPSEARILAQHGALDGNPAHAGTIH